MQKTGKLLLGAATLWPIVYLFVFFITIFSTIFFMPGPEKGPPPLIAIILPLHLLTMLLIMGLTIFYIVNVFRNPRVEKDQKALWAIVIFLGNMIGMPIYWYLYVWKEPVTAGTVPPAQLNSVDASAWTSNTSSSRQEQSEYAPPREPPNWRE